MRILKHRIGIEKKIDEFLDQVSRSGLIFRQGIEAYLHGDEEDFQRKLEEIVQVEHRGDELRRTIEVYLYTKTLIPESRGDVLELLENLDGVLLDQFKGALWRFEIERPEIEAQWRRDFLRLAQVVVEAAETIVQCSRAFFKDIEAVANYLDKVSYWESEADKLATRLQRAIFQRQDLRLSHRMQLRDFARHLDQVADKAEDIADRLNIYVIKRSL